MVTLEQLEQLEGRIVKALKAGDEGFHLVLQGLKRFRVLALTQTTPYLRARVVEVKDT